MTALASRGGPLTGVANQTRREAGQWWATRRWWTSALAWTVVLNGVLALLLWVVPRLDGPAELAAFDLTELAVQFAGLAAVLTAAGTVLVTQGLLLDDRRDGLVEWLLSKPLARPALIVAKFAGHAPALLVVAVVIPWMGVWLQLSVAAGEPWPAGRWLAAVALVALLAAFQLSLVLALSTVTASRAMVLAVPLAALVASDVVTSFAPWTADWLPWGIGRISGVVLTHGDLVSAQLVVVTVAATAAAVLAAAWRFSRVEL